VNPRVIILTSTFRRHHFLCRYLAARLSVVGVWQEEKSFKPTSYANGPGDADIIRRHFLARDDAEARDFSDIGFTVEIDPQSCRQVLVGGLNDPNEVTRMVAMEPDVVVVFGTGILKGDILSRFEGQLLNIHLGLSPYYRGAGTNFWPLVNGEPEFVGATIHYLDSGIDTGPIISHVRPDIDRADGPHELGNKAIYAAAEGMVKAVKAHHRGRLRSHPQTWKGRLYQRKDFNAEAVRQLYEQFDQGILGNYLDAKQARDERISLVSLEEEK